MRLPEKRTKINKKHSMRKLKKALALLVVSTIVISCGKNGLKISNDEEIKFVQRESKTIKGSDGDVEIYIGDVTMGQAQIVIKGIGNNKLYFKSDMSANSEGYFQYEKNKYYRIKVNKFENHLVHDDLAFISMREISEEIGKQKAMAITDNKATAISGDEIRKLIDRVKNSKLKFIRNGELLEDSVMAEHIESKYILNREDIKTKEDFIDRIISKSMTTGETYKVILGKDTLKLADWILGN
jgi:hypothetical protein